ncbi:ABC transporter permease [Dactylosporangium sucinum]|uniref:ABC transporter permease n=1 Tax=Dactylosporangium sucinum TaxID=1424081 RepID=A0A917UCG2_9ACTN|nr:ABC transporter permease [Dactylosporangium sucinum]GGM81526.1 ABC transporter permease [Dactylosporangium sucinum]
MKIIKRLVTALLMLFVVSLLVFLFTQALPGDIARQVLGQNATPDQIARLRQQLGLDQSLLHQYLNWVGNLARFDLGTSLASGSPVGDLIGTRILNSATLVAATALLLFPLALLLGTAAARRPEGLIDQAVSAAALVVLAIPEFIIAILVVVVLATNVLRVLPPTSVVDPAHPAWQQPELLALPTLALVVGSLPYLTESVKTTLREELASEHVLWARLSGVPEWRIIWRHGLPNTIGPSLQVAATTLIYLTGGIVAVETVFAFPGLGSALVEAVNNRDIPVVQAITMLLAAIALLVYVVADVGGVLTNPRLRTRRTA